MDMYNFGKVPTSMICILIACSVVLSYYINRADQWYNMPIIPLKGTLVHIVNKS